MELKERRLAKLEAHADATGAGVDMTGHSRLEAKLAQMVADIEKRGPRKIGKAERRRLDEEWREMCRQRQGVYKSKRQS